MHASPRSLRQLAFVLAIAFGALALGACGSTASGNGGAATDASGKPLIAQPVSCAPVPATEATKPGEVDYSCTTDADCAVKAVGNCCGYYPACVNTNSPTFPEQVKAECAQNDMQSVCGFRDIEGCACVEGRCEAGPATSGEAVR
ncbi:MAG: hypothetical protein ACK5S2_11005 [Lysobacteraceae bacterium]